jgi:DNA-binding transcriptional MerR regulator
MPPESSAQPTLTGITRREVLYYRSRGLLDESEILSRELERRVRRIRRLRRDLGLSYDVITLVLPLIERIEQLEGRSVELPAVRIVGR